MVSVRFGRAAARRLTAVFAVLVGVIALAACGSSNSSSTAVAGGSTTAATTPSGASTTAAASGTGSATGTSTGATTSSGPVTLSSCGTKPGVKATGTPINIGTIDTKQPGTDFSDGPNMINAYFACVNANGGVNGHPLKLFVEYDQTQPAQVAAAAKQLIQTDKVVAIDGVFDLLECTIDQQYWKQLGIYEMGAGIAPECWSTPNSAAVNMGPRYSSDGAVQYALAQHVSKIVFVQSNVPGTGYIAAGPAALAKASNTPITELTANVPINDANSLALKLVDDAGSNGWVVLNFTPPEALVILQAAQKLGLEDRVKGWGCSTPCNTDFLAKALGPKWNHKLFVNAELTDPDDHNGPDMQLYKMILAKYGSAVAGGIGSFSQMGFLLGKFLTQALETIKGPYTMKSVNAAIKAINGYKTDLLCQPWVYGSLPLHIPNNTDYTTTPDNGKMVTAQGCTAISSADPQIAAYHKAAAAAGVDYKATGS
jgi:branched-chain amino acid transport system substrate-binding protein